MLFWLGVLAGAAALAVTGAARALLIAPFVPELLALRLFELVPMDVFSFFIRRLGEWSKWAAFAGAIGLTLAGAGAFAWVAPAFLRGAGKAGRWFWLTAVSTLLFTFVFMPAVGSGPLGFGLYPPLRVPAPVGLFLGAGTYAAVLIAGLERSAVGVRLNTKQ